MTNPHRHIARDGYVLISVLAVIALLSGLVAALLLLGRATTDTAGLESESLRQDMLVQSAVALSGYQLFVLKRPEADVNGQQLRLDAGVVTLTVSSDAGKVDLNASAKELLAAAYRASGLETLSPEAFAGRVLDWRDGDDEQAADGAEAPAYQGLGHRPRNGPFRSLDDLRFVVGVSAADVERLRPFLTIFNATGRLSATLAPEALVAALPGISSETVKTLLSLRRAGNADRTKQIADLLLVQASLIDTAPPSTYRVNIDARTGQRASPRRVSVVLSAGATPAAPYQVLEWTEQH
jgi:general secretion pathway protein K